MFGSIMAALHNGPGLRKDKKPWQARDFVQQPWQPRPTLQTTRKKGAKSPTRAAFASKKVT